jgi:uncharacterized protein (TIGR02677 family)
MADSDTERLVILSYLLAERAPLYRGIMRVFTEARARYEVYRRPAEVLANLEANGLTLAPEDEAHIDAALDQLVQWGNLSRTHQTAGARSLEEWRQRRYLYQITTAGERAEHHIGALVDALDDQGALQRVMLRLVRENLEALAAQTESHRPDPDKLFGLLGELHNQFTSLTQNASAFLTTVGRALDATAVETTAFHSYKLAVLTYIEGFIEELQRLASPIRDAIVRVERAELRELFELAAGVDEAPVLDGVPHDQAVVFAAQWRGLRAWFIGVPGQEPSSDALKREARAAVARMLNILRRLGEARSGKISRRSDLIALARRFDACADDAEAHATFKAAFGLFGARHLAVVNERDELSDESLELPRDSWWIATPVEVPVRLRETGAHAQAGRSSAVEDFGAAKSRLRQPASEQRGLRENAMSALVGRGPFSLSDLDALPCNEFHALVEMLAFAVARPRHSRDRLRVLSHDGRLIIAVAWPPDDAWAIVQTRDGTLHLPDYEIEISPRVPARMSEAR